MFVRTFRGVKMNGIQIWVTTIILHAVLLTANCAKPHRRSMPTQQTLPVSKGGWRPVVGSSGLVFGFGTAPLHAPSYKIPVQLDSFPSSARPLSAREATKLTSIAQSYRPTTLRTIQASPAASQPISAYLNPFALPNNGLTHYKYVQNFPVESVVIRNPHNPFAARPVFGKPYPTKSPFAVKQQYPFQQLTNYQQFQFPIPTTKPGDLIGKPVNIYAKPTDSKTAQSGGTEIYKTEVYKLQDSDTAQQSLTQQQVKTAQQAMVTPKIPVNPYSHYPYQEPILSNIFGTFGSFGLQPGKHGTNQLYPTKTTFFPPQGTKQTLFNSYSFAPNFKTTSQFVSTTPKLQSTANQIHYNSNWNDFKAVVTQVPKPQAPVPAKIDPNSHKGQHSFKSSPQDPFVTKFPLNGDYKVSTYNPTVQTTTFAYSNYHDYNYSPQQNFQPQQNYYNTNYNQQQQTYNHEKKKNKIHAHDSVGLNQQTSQQYVNPPQKYEIEGTPNSVPHRATYEVTENYENEEVTSSVPQSWSPQSDTQNGQKSTEEAVTKQEFDAFNRPTTLLPDVPEEYAIVTEGEKGYENSLGYDNQIESQSRRPLGDDFEPIVKHRLKDYYYRVSTPAYDDHSGRRTKKPTESSRYQEVSTQVSANKETNEADVLPTLPPNKHFKRPSQGPSSPAPEVVDKDRIRKRTKIRRRRPQQPSNNGSRRPSASTTEATSTDDDVHTIKPRTRPTASKPNLTTPTTSAVDLTTSALPTISPTAPTIIKKKLVNRRPYTTITTDKPDTTTTTVTHESNKESPIMKISASTRPQYPKLSPTAFDFRLSETPDYSHKQDEKDTPTSDIAIDTLKTNSKSDSGKPFSFHRDAKPVEAKLEPIIREVITTEDSISDSNEVTTTSKPETTSNTAKILRPRLKNKFGRPGFSVKDYRNRLSSTTSTEKSADTQTPKIRFPNRRIPVSENKVNENDNGTERKKFMPKDPRHKQNGSEISEQTEKEIHSIRPNRHRQPAEATEGPAQKISARIRNGSRRPKPTEESVETTSSTPSKRPLRKKIKDTDIGESVQDITVTESNANEQKNDITSERTRSESAIMKIADKKHQDHLEHIFEHSKRVSDLTLAASKDYNTPGMFKTVASNSRRIPNYFTIATDDPILPIEAFFPQINQKKES